MSIPRREVGLELARNCVQGIVKFGHTWTQPNIVNGATGAIEYKPSWYYIGHFSRFIRPGSMRVGCTRHTDAVECAAFRTPDDGRVLVALNRTDHPVSFVLRNRDRVADVAIPVHGIATLRWGGR